MTERLTPDRLDEIDARRLRTAFSTTSYQDAQALIDEVRASWAERDRLRAFVDDFLFDCEDENGNLIHEHLADLRDAAMALLDGETSDG